MKAILYFLAAFVIASLVLNGQWIIALLIPVVLGFAVRIVTPSEKE